MQRTVAHNFPGSDAREFYMCSIRDIGTHRGAELIYTKRELKDFFHVWKVNSAHLLYIRCKASAASTPVTLFPDHKYSKAPARVEHLYTPFKFFSRHLKVCTLVFFYSFTLVSLSILSSSSFSTSGSFASSTKIVWRRKQDWIIHPRG